MDPAYVLSVLNSPLGRGHFLKTGKTTSGLNTISTGVVRSLRVPVPPVEAMERFAQLREATLPVMLGADENSNSVAFELDVSLSAHAFSGLLTADWREVHKDKLAIEAGERDAALAEVGSTPRLSHRVTIQQTERGFADHTDGIYSDLNREQRFLLSEIERIFGEVDHRPYFTAERIADDIEEVLNRNPQGVFAHLQVFAARGLVIPVSRRRKDANGSPFAACFRLPIETSERQTPSGEEDIELAEQPGDDVRGELMKIQRGLATGRI